MKTNTNSKVLAVVFATLAVLPGAAFATDAVNGMGPVARITHVTPVRHDMTALQAFEGRAALQFNLIDGQPVR